MPTGINKELVRNTWMVHIMDGTSKYGRQNLQICEHILKIVKTRMMFQVPWLSKSFQYETVNVIRNYFSLDK